MSRNIQRAVSLGIYADVTQATREMRQLNRILGSLVDPTKKLDRQTADLNLRFEKNEVNTKAMTEAKKRLIIQHDKEAKALDKLKRKYHEITTARDIERQKRAGQRAKFAEVGRFEEADAASAAGRQALEARLAAFKKRRRAEEAEAKKREVELERERKALEKVAEAERKAAGEARKRRDEQNKRAGLRTQYAMRGRFDEQEATDAAARLAYQDKLRAKLAATRAEEAKRNATLAEGAQYMQQFETRQMQVNRQMAEAAGLYQRGAITAGQYATALKGIRAQASLAHKALASMRGVLLTVLGPLVIAFKAFEGISASIRLAADLEAAEADLKVFTGSLESARDILTELRALSAKGVSFEVSQRAVSTMLQFGAQGDKVLGYMKQISEVTGGNTMRMESMALAIGQVIAAGRLMGQENLQLVNAGFPALALLGEKLGKTGAEMKKLMEEGAISSQMVLDVLDESTALGGRYFGRLEEKSKTLRGQFNLLRAEAELLGTAIGDISSGPAGGGTDWFTKTLADMRAIIEGVQEAKKSAKNDSPEGLGFNNLGQIVDPTRTGEKTVWEHLRDSGPVIGMARIYAKAQREHDMFKKFSEGPMGPMGDVEGGFGPEGRAARIAKAERRAEQERREMAKRKRQNELIEEAKLVDEAFGGAMKGAQDSLIEQRYGEDAAKVQMILQQSVAGEHAKLKSLIDQGAAYDKILAASNATTQATVRELTSMERQLALAEKKRKKEEEDEKRAERITKILKDRNKEFAENAEDVRKSLDPNSSFIEERARLQAMKQKGLLSGGQFTQALGNLLESSVGGSNRIQGATGARAGSQQAFESIRNRQLSSINTQLKESEKQTLLLQTQVEAGKRQVELLEELVEVKPGTLD